MEQRGAGMSRRHMIRRGGKLAVIAGVTTWATPIALSSDLVSAAPGSAPPGDRVLPREEVPRADGPRRQDRVRGQGELPRTGDDLSGLTVAGIALTGAGLAALAGDEAHKRWKRKRRKDAELEAEEAALAEGPEAD